VDDPQQRAADVDGLRQLGLRVSSAAFGRDSRLANTYRFQD
jgi:hypothetical protein